MIQQQCAKDVPCLLSCLPRLHGSCGPLLWPQQFNGESIGFPWPRTMAPLFPWPGCQLKETPIREASISGVRLRGHTQVRLLFMSAKPIKTLQPPLLTPTCLALWQIEEEFLHELKSQSATNLTTASICPSYSKLKCYTLWHQVNKVAVWERGTANWLWQAPQHLLCITSHRFCHPPNLPPEPRDHFKWLLAHTGNY